jgi:hypothetical protein
MAVPRHRSPPPASSFQPEVAVGRVNERVGGQDDWIVLEDVAKSVEPSAGHCAHGVVDKQEDLRMRRVVVNGVIANRIHQVVDDDDRTVT